VVDRGFAGDDNLAYLTRAGGHWIAGERLRDNTPDVAQVLSRQGRYQQVRDNLRVKEIRLGSGDGVRRFVLCHNPTQADRDRVQREQQLALVEGELQRIAALRAKHAKAAGKRRRGTDDHLKAECALRDHPTLGRWLRQTLAGGWSSTAPRSRPKPRWTASSCCQPPILTCRPRTSRWATRTCWRPSGPSGT
jgi:hypothetical protein